MSNPDASGEYARDFEIEIRYKELKNTANNVESWSPYEIFSAVGNLRLLEGNNSDRYEINDEVDELMAAASATSDRLSKLDYQKDEKIYVKMYERFEIIIREILDQYADLPIEDDIPF